MRGTKAKLLRRCAQSISRTAGTADGTRYQTQTFHTVKVKVPDGLRPDGTMRMVDVHVQVTNPILLAPGARATYRRMKAHI